MKKIKQKTVSKPRDYVNIAMMKRGGAGSHEKPHKVNRRDEKVEIKKTLKP